LELDLELDRRLDRDRADAPREDARRATPAAAVVRSSPPPNRGGLAARSSASRSCTAGAPRTAHAARDMQHAQSDWDYEMDRENTAILKSRIRIDLQPGDELGAAGGGPHDVVPDVVQRVPAAAEHLPRSVKVKLTGLTRN
jgi:hypothetical protein